MIAMYRIPTAVGSENLRPDETVPPLSARELGSGCPAEGHIPRPLHWIGLSFLCCILLAAGADSIASEPFEPVVGDPLEEPWRWRTFTELTGFGLQCMDEGADGTLWFGVSDGVWSYDGFDWIYHDKRNLQTEIESICKNPDGEICITLWWGVLRYVDGELSRVFPLTEAPREMRIAKAFFAKDGTLWLATTLGAIRVNGKCAVIYTAPEIAAMLAGQTHPFTSIEILPEDLLEASGPGPRYDLEEICEDSTGRLWMGTHQGEVLCFDPSAGGEPDSSGSADSGPQWRVFNEADGIDVGKTPAILAARDGRMWVVYGSESEHINVFDGQKWEAIRLLDAGLQPNGGCARPIQTRDGTVWLSGRYAISAYRDGQWTTYSKPDNPIPSARNLLLQTSDGALWIGGPSTDVVRVDYETPRWKTLEDLNFGWEGQDGTEWFLHRNGRIVAHRGDDWTSYGPEDNVIGSPVAILGTKSGDVWVAGSHEEVAATARFDGSKWTRHIHDEFSWGVDWRGTLEASDGSLWFSAAVDSSGPKHHCRGILQFKDGVWIHHHQREYTPTTQHTELLPPFGSLTKLSSLGESSDGRIWAGRMGEAMAVHDQSGWKRYNLEAGPSGGNIESILTTNDCKLWIGSQQFGAVCYDGREWKHYQGNDSLGAHAVYSLAQTADGTVWAATDRGFSRFDGISWSSITLPPHLNLATESGYMMASRHGIWINHRPREWNLRDSPEFLSPGWETGEFRATQYDFRGVPPRTVFESGPKEVHYPGNLSVLWSGAAQWREYEKSQLQFSYRIDDQPWSAFDSMKGHSFFTVPSGPHVLEVRARDNEFNIDPSPAVHEFVVFPPVWRQSWFMGLMLVSTGLILAQSFRVVQERSRLRQTNTVLGVEIEDRKRTEDLLQSHNQVLQQLASESPLEVVLDTITKAIEHQFPGMMSSILLLDGRQLKHGSAPSLPDEYNRQIDGLEVGPTVGSCGTAVFEKRRVVVEDTQTDPKWENYRRLASEFGLRACWSQVILNERGDVLGTFALYYSNPRSPTSEELELIDQFANLAKIAIERFKSEENLRRRETELAHVGRLSMLGETVAEIAHEISQPLYSINNFSQACLNEVSKNDGGSRADVLDWLQRIRLASVRSTEVLGRIAEFVRSGDRQRAACKVTDLIDDMLALTSWRIKQQRIEVKVVVPNPEVEISADRIQVEQVLLNVLLNACDAIQLASNTAQGRIVVEVIEREQEVEIVISDNGPGIREEIRQNLFEPFMTTKSDGMGMGLAISRSIVEHHGGRIWTTNNSPSGACFHVSFPLQSAQTN